MEKNKHTITLLRVIHLIHTAVSKERARQALGYLEAEEETGEGYKKADENEVTGERRYELSFSSSTVRATSMPQSGRD